MQGISRRRIIIAIIIVVIIVGLFITGLLIALNKSATQNQFGGYIKIQNYDQKIKHLSADMKDSIQTSLYNLVKKNSSDNFDPTTIKDATIRDNSDRQDFKVQTSVYSGKFIVDMQSVKQSYQIQYSYSPTQNAEDTGGSPVVISCLSSNDLIYGTFNCTDFVTEQSNPNDDILQYLPYTSLSYNIYPNATAADGHLELDVDLVVSDLDLSGDAASRAQTIMAYKKDVTDWIQSVGVDPTKYPIKYNYSDTGEYLGSTKPQ